MIIPGFIKVPRTGDDTEMLIRADQIQAVVVNADEKGPIEGTSAIYLHYGLAFAVNKTVDEVEELIIQAGRLN